MSDKTDIVITEHKTVNMVLTHVCISTLAKFCAFVSLMIDFELTCYFTVPLSQMYL